MYIYYIHIHILTLYIVAFQMNNTHQCKFIYDFFIPSHQHQHMVPGNDTQNPGFLLQGLSVEPELQSLIFGMFLSMYLITLFGNLLIILAISLDSHLHIPMYFFISNLSFVDNLFHYHDNPKDVNKYTDPEQSYILWRVHHPDVFLHAVCSTG